MFIPISRSADRVSLLVREPRRAGRRGGQTGGRGEGRNPHCPLYLLVPPSSSPPARLRPGRRSSQGQQHSRRKSLASCPSPPDSPFSSLVRRSASPACATSVSVSAG